MMKQTWPSSASRVDRFVNEQLRARQHNRRNRFESNCLHLENRRRCDSEGIETLRSNETQLISDSGVMPQRAHLSSGCYRELPVQRRSIGPIDWLSSCPGVMVSRLKCRSWPEDEPPRGAIFRPVIMMPRVGPPGRAGQTRQVQSARIVAME